MHTGFQNQREVKTMAVVETVAGSGLGRASLFEAAQRLQEAASLPTTSDRWLAQAQSAVRHCTFAIEAALDNLSAPDGLGGEVQFREPRLIPSLERLEAAMATMLLEFWQAKARRATPDFVQRLSLLAVALRAAATDAFELAHEAQISPAGED